MFREPSYAEKNYNQERESGKNIHVLKDLWPYLTPYPKIIFGALASILLASVASLGIGQSLKYIIDFGFRSQNGHFLDYSLLFLIFMICLIALASYGRLYLVSWLAERCITQIRKDVFENLLRQDIAFFETNSSGEILSRLTADTTLIHVVVGTSVPIALRNILLLIGGIIMLLVSSTMLSLIVFVTVPIVVIPLILYGKKVRTLARNAQDKLANVSAFSIERLSSIKTIQAFCQEKKEAQKFFDHAESAFQTSLIRLKARSILTALVIVIVSLAVACVLWFGGHDVLKGALTAGDLSAFLFYAVVVAGSLGALSEVVGDLQRAAGASERLLELAKLTPLITSPEKPEKIENPEGRIDFINVNFCYPTRPETFALQKLNITIAPGEKVAFVGSSGAGKSTIFQLLLRFYDVNFGDILIDGKPLKNLHLQDFRHLIALVPQDPILFSGSVFENIAFSKDGATYDDVVNASKAAFAHDFIQELPFGYATQIGENGTRLSGGQRQRIAIARALLKDPKILLLDEATNALDAESEKHVQAALEALMENRTTLIVAHRLNTVAKADRIFVIENGEVIESGTHQQLLAHDNIYAKLIKLQFEAL